MNWNTGIIFQKIVVFLIFNHALCWLSLDPTLFPFHRCVKVDEA